jgi:hypothetical protein
MNDRSCGNGHTWRRLKNGAAFLLDGPHGEKLSFAPPAQTDVLDKHGGFTAFIQTDGPNGDYTLWRPGQVLKYGTTGTLKNFGKGFYQLHDDVTWAAYKVKGYRYSVLCYFDNQTGGRIA